MTEIRTDRCRIRDCQWAATVTVTFGEFSPVQARLCDQHKPTVEQALRRHRRRAVDGPRLLRGRDRLPARQG